MHHNYIKCRCVVIKDLVLSLISSLIYSLPFVQLDLLNQFSTSYIWICYFSWKKFERIIFNTFVSLRALCSCVAVNHSYVFVGNFFRSQLAHKNNKMLPFTCKHSHNYRDNYIHICTWTFCSLFSLTTCKQIGSLVVHEPTYALPLWLCVV